MKKCQYNKYNKILHGLKPIRVSKKLITEWFNFFNSELFDNELYEFHNIQIKNDLKNWAFCSYRSGRYELIINPYFPNGFIFCNVLSHEMIHMFQYSNYETMDHGKTFWCWKNKFSNLQLILKEQY